MPDDQQISQSVDNVIAETPDDQAADQPAQPDASPSAYSLGSSPPSDLPANDTAASDEPISETGGPVTQPTTAPTDDGVVNVDQTSSSSSDDLSDIKQQALSQLTPIIGDLDQTPEEKYRTLMMLIQASDDKSLLKNAFEAASSIEDKKAKAEALLNIVNEINYFSASKAQSDEPNELASS